MPQIRIVLVETSHPGNIGASARAMKNMGLFDLALVAPRRFPHAEATARAAGADDVLARAGVFRNLTEAVADCHLVIGASARPRTIPWPRLTPRQCAESVWREAAGIRTAIVFGREQSGLTNAELDLCQYWLHIPCNPDYSSLNVAAAVQIVAYELHVARSGLRQASDTTNSDGRPATQAEMESFYAHLHQTLREIGFIHPTKHPSSILRRLRRLFGRARLEKREVDMLRGILACAQHPLRKKESC